MDYGMNYTAIFNLISKNFVKCFVWADEKVKPFAFANYDNKIAVTDGYRMFFIPARLFPFDLDKLILDGNSFAADKVIPNKDALVPATLTKEMRVVKKGVARKIESEAGAAWFDVKLLDSTFGDLEKLKYFLVAKRPEISPVVIYDEDELIGLVLPLRMNNEEEK